MILTKIILVGLLILIISTRSIGSRPNITVFEEHNFQQIAEAARFLGNYFEFSSDVYIIIVISPKLPNRVDGYTLYEDHLNQEGIKQFFIKISSKLSLKRQLAVIAHEMVHVKQFLSGELIKQQDQCYQWKGHKCLNTNHLDYLDRPWEQEAIRMQYDLVKLYKRSKIVQKRKDIVFHSMH